MAASDEADILTKKSETARIVAAKKHRKSSSMSATKKKTSNVATIGWISALVALISAVITLLWPTIIEALLKMVLVFSKDSPLYELWVDYPIPIHMEVHFFNCTNPNDILQKGAKPKFSQLGPYVFREYDKKVDVEFTDHFTVKYNLTRKWVFLPHLSNGTFDDQVTSIDLVAYSAAFVLRNNSLSMRFLISHLLTLYRYNTFSTHTVRELLFDGYTDPLLTISYIMPFVDVPQDKMAYFYSRNGSSTYEGRFEVNTGADYLNKFGKLLNWNGKTHYDFYEGECNRIDRGSAESILPQLTKDSRVSIFSADLCRTFTMTFKEETSVKGLATYRFWSDSNAFSKGSINPDNLCYERDDDPSFPNGVLYIGRCMKGSPFLASWPHFFNGDPSLVEAVEGLAPKEEFHMAYMDIEPLTAYPIYGIGKLQLNLALEPIEGVSLFSNVPKLVFPLMWMSVKAELPNDFVTMIKVALCAEFVVRIAFLVLLCVSLKVLLFSLFFKFYKQMKTKTAISNVLYTEVQQVLK